MNIKVDLGPATAYALAVSGGYTGTAEEFSLLMANYMQYAQEVATNKTLTEQLKTQAGEFANTATVEAGKATTSATAAKASENSAAANVAKIDGMTASIEQLAYTEAPVVIKSEIDGKYNLHFKIPAGRIGSDGEPGKDGKTATIRVDQVATGAPGSNAIVSNSSTDPSAAVLNFTIPQGMPGAPAGIGTPIVVSKTLESGLAATAEIAVSGPDTAKVFTFTFGIPKGTDGVNGKSPTMEIGTVTTGLPGSKVTFVNSGTSTNAIFDVSIPKGDKGDKGDTPVKGNDYFTEADIARIEQDLKNYIDQEILKGAS